MLVRCRLLQVVIVASLHLIIVAASSARALAEQTEVDASLSDEGWKTILDPKTEKYYWHNANTKESQWEKPTSQNQAAKKKRNTELWKNAKKRVSQQKIRQKIRKAFASKFGGSLLPYSKIPWVPNEDCKTACPSCKTLAEAEAKLDARDLSQRAVSTSILTHCLQPALLASVGEAFDIAAKGLECLLRSKKTRIAAYKEKDGHGPCFELTYTLPEALRPNHDEMTMSTNPLVKGDVIAVSSKPMQRVFASRYLMHALSHAAQLNEYFAFRVLYLTTSPTAITAGGLGPTEGPKRLWNESGSGLKLSDYVDTFDKAVVKDKSGRNDRVRIAELVTLLSESFRDLRDARDTTEGSGWTAPDIKMRRYKDEEGREYYNTGEGASQYNKPEDFDATVKKQKSLTKKVSLTDISSSNYVASSHGMFSYVANLDAAPGKKSKVHPHNCMQQSVEEINILSTHTDKCSFGLQTLCPTPIENLVIGEEAAEVGVPPKKPTQPTHWSSAICEGKSRLGALLKEAELPRCGGGREESPCRVQFKMRSQYEYIRKRSFYDWPVFYSLNAFDYVFDEVFQNRFKVKSKDGTEKVSIVKEGYMERLEALLGYREATVELLKSKTFQFKGKPQPLGAPSDPLLLNVMAGVGTLAEIEKKLAGLKKARREALKVKQEEDKKAAAAALKLKQEEDEKATALKVKQEEDKKAAKSEFGEGWLAGLKLKQKRAADAKKRREENAKKRY